MGFIYKIENLKTNEVYIGQTKRSVAQRWWEHLTEKANPSNKLYQAFQNYHLEDFDITTLEECEDILLDEREKYWISIFDSFQSGYNSTLGGSGKRFDYEAIVNDFLITKDTYKTKKNFNCSINTVKRALKIYNIPYDDKEKMPIKIDQIDSKTLKIINTYSSMSEAVEKHPEWNVSTLSGVISGRRKSAYGFYWQRHGENKIFIPNQAVAERIAIEQYDLKGNFLNSFKSIADANRFLGKQPYNGSISRVINGKAKTAHGYIWKKKE